jgi:UDP-GlcNAc:undecaprenyl-phosphate GlcNAc-1-phosphate transferase
VTVLPWIPLLAAACSLLCHAAALRVFPRLGLLDFPERYGLARPRIPYPTGIVSVLVFLAFYLSLAPWSLKTASTSLAILVLGVFCFTDDRRPLPPLLRGAVQALIAVLVFVGGARIFSFTNPLAGIVGGPVLELTRWSIPFPMIGSLPILSLLFTVFWIGLTINALNWFDGLPGQVSTLSFIGFLTIGFLSLSSRVQQPQLALYAFVLAGIVLGSLVFELPGSRMLIGDSGAMFFGLMLGVLTIYSGGKVATAFLVLGVPLVDFALVIGRRLLKRRSPLKGNATDEHLHHRLLQKGWKRIEIILLTAGIGTAFGVSALFFSTAEKFLAAIALFLLMLALSLYSKPMKRPSPAPPLPS